jgi:hypothetical protein
LELAQGEELQAASRAMLAIGSQTIEVYEREVNSGEVIITTLHSH